jgi:UDP-GlcNAc:undecaprenyl-phosphate GlcNAc-1-phosphate transferase
VSLLATPLFRWFALRKNICDRPDHAVKIHKAPIPYLGGGAIWLAWTLAVMTYCLWASAHDESVDWRGAMALLAGGAVAFVTGLVDDLRDIQPRTKLLGQAVAGAILLLGGIQWAAYPNFAWLPVLNLGPDTWLVVAVCLGMHFTVVIGATNATNLLDGLDGLCSGVTVIISVGFLLLATGLIAWADYDPAQRALSYEHMDLVLAVSFALAGAAIGFLPYNFNPARIFMGDAGSVFIGYVLAAMMIMFASHHGVVKWFVGALFIFGVPIFDTGVAVIRRVLNHRPIMRPDRSHVYNQLVDRLGLRVRSTVVILYSTSILFAAAGLLVLYLPGTRALFLYMLVGAAILVVVWRLGFLRMTSDEIAAADRSLAQKRRL